MPVLLSKNELKGKGHLSLNGLKPQHLMFIALIVVLHLVLLGLIPMGVLKDGRPVITSLFSITGVLIGILGIYSIRGLWTLMRNYKRTSATVVDYVYSYGRGKYLLVKYNFNGEDYTGTTLNGGGMPDRGTRVGILFNPAGSSKEIYINNSALYVTPFLILIMSAVFLFFSYRFGWQIYLA